MSDPNATVGPQNRPSTGTRTAVAIQAIVDSKAKQALHAAERPLHSLFMAVGHTLGAAVVWAFTAWLSTKGAPWWALAIGGVAGFYVAAPTTTANVVTFLFAKAGDVKDRFLPKPGG